MNELSSLNFNTVLLIILLVIRIYIHRSMILPKKIYKEALKNENDGLFHKAQLGYQYAMQEIKRKKFQSRQLKNKITGKLNLLQDVIEYNTVGTAII